MSNQSPKATREQSAVHALLLNSYNRSPTESLSKSETPRQSWVNPSAELDAAGVNFCDRKTTLGEQSDFFKARKHRLILPQQILLHAGQRAAFKGKLVIPRLKSRTSSDLNGNSRIIQFSLGIAKIFFFFIYDGIFPVTYLTSTLD